MTFSPLRSVRGRPRPGSACGAADGPEGESNAPKTVGKVSGLGWGPGYNGEDISLRRVRSILVNRLKVQGFIVSDHPEVWPQALKELGEKVVNGSLRYRETVAQGLEKAPEAFISLLAGGNLGKQLVKLA